MSTPPLPPSTSAPVPAGTPDTHTSMNAEAGPSTHQEPVDGAMEDIAQIPGASNTGESSLALQSLNNNQIKVFAPPTTAPITPVEDLPESYFTPTSSDVQAAQASLIKRSKQLNERPLTIGRVRDDEKARKEKERQGRWPNTIIRIRFSDRTQIQQTFPSSSRIQPVYQFVRDSLSDSTKSKSFVLYQPPSRSFPEHPTLPPPPKNKPRIPLRPGEAKPTPKNPTLAELEMVPQSVLLVRFDEDELNASDRPAPLQPSLLAHATPLPIPSEEPSKSADTVPTADTLKRKESGTGEKKMPKWLQKGLGKK